MSLLGLDEKPGRAVPDTPLTRQTDKEITQYELGKERSKGVVIGTLSTSFVVCLFLGEGLAESLGGVLGVILVAGVPSAVAAKFKAPWRPVWIIFAALAIVSHVTMYFYEQQNLPEWQRTRTNSTSNR